ncbi:MAG: DUF3795 domain-containing protein [Desulfobacteraceae bacterium]|nr:MAG: DUF3795 domain-containing protein [Desulfobacteraceae bacterium]
MDYKRYTAFCGIDCFNCEVFKENVTPELQNRLASIYKKKPEEIKCNGCRDSGCLILPYPCPTKACAGQKGVDFCSDCAEFPCNRLQPCSDKADRLPHNLKVFNLCRIKAVGLDQWAKETPEIRARYFKGEMIIGKGPQR